MEGIKVSVIVPVYNVEEYVAECIESILNQSLKEIEIIIVDDCSTDNSYHICRKYETDNPDKIRLFRHEKNLGLPSARNTGLKHAKGDYIGFVDSDDFYNVPALLWIQFDGRKQKAMNDGRNRKC